MYFSQRLHRAITLSVLLGVLLFTTPAFCIPGFDDLKGDYVLVPGYRFSQMYDTKAKGLIWLPQSTIDDPSVTQRMDLALYIQGNEPDGFEAQGLLKSVGPLKLYQTFSDYIQSLPGKGSQFNYHEFAYDWRRSDDAIAQLLVDFLQNIYDNNGNKPINVLSHSLGGPIALLALHSKPNLFAGSIFVGGAFKGGPYIFSEFKFGRGNLDPKKPPLQDATSCFTMRPGFSIIPPTSAFVDKNGQPINIDPFDMNVWTQSTFTDVIIDDSPRNRQLGPKEQRLKYLRRTLMASRSIYDEMKFRPGFSYPPLVMLTSEGFSTITGFPMAKNADGLWAIDYNNAIMGKGDSILPFESTVLSDFPHALITTQTTHVAQFENLNEIGQALAKLHDMQHMTD